MNTIEKNEESVSAPAVKRKSILKNNFVGPLSPDKHKNSHIQISNQQSQESKENKQTHFCISYNVAKIFFITLFNQNWYVVAMSFFTIYSLFADDIRMAFLPKSSDAIIDSFLIVSMVLNGMEWVISTIFKDNYVLSFYFFVDLCSALSIVFDVQLIFNPYNTYKDYLNSK